MKKLTYLTAVLLILAAPLAPQMIGETTYFTSFAANYLFHNNLHEVVPGRFYRSADMSREDLEQTMREKGIKTVINLQLRGDEPDEEGRTEKSVVEKNGGKYFTIPISSARANQIDKLEKLLDIYDQAETPVLVHCLSGTHRAGIASAIWLLERENAGIEKANEQISLRYGFIDAERKLKTLVQGEPTLDTVLKRYAAAQKAEPIAFREWLEKQQLD